MKFLKRIPLLAVVFLFALAILPSTLSGYWPSSGVVAAPAYAPYFPPPSQAPAKGSEIEVLLKNFEFTQTDTSPIGVRPRR